MNVCTQFPDDLKGLVVKMFQDHCAGVSFNTTVIYVRNLKILYCVYLW